MKVWIIGGLQEHQNWQYTEISPTLTQAMGMGGGQTPCVLVSPKSTNTPSKSILNTPQNIKIMETSPKSPQPLSPTSTSSSEDSLAKLFQSLESELASKTFEELSSMMSLEFLKKSTTG